MRTRAILASPEAWKRAHLYAAPHLRRLAVLCFVFSGIQLIFENPWVASLLNLDEDALMIIGVAPTAIVIGLLLLLAHKADEVAKSTPPR